MLIRIACVLPIAVNRTPKLTKILHFSIIYFAHTCIPIIFRLSWASQFQLGLITFSELWLAWARFQKKRTRKIVLEYMSWVAFFWGSCLGLLSWTSCTAGFGKLQEQCAHADGGRANTMGMKGRRNRKPGHRCRCSWTSFLSLLSQLHTAINLHLHLNQTRQFFTAYTLASA
jgi:hypothetical protein